MKIQTPAMIRFARDTVHTVWAFMGWQIAMYLQANREECYRRAGHASFVALQLNVEV